MQMQMSIYAWGANSAGQLGLSDSEDRATPCETRVLGGWWRAEPPVPALQAGGGSSAALLPAGSVVVWGAGVGAQPALPVAASVCSAAGSGVRALACGWAHSLALAADGLHSWGSNEHGQVSLPALGPAPHPVLAAGLRHSLAVRGDGRVVGWGDNRHAQLPHGPLADEHVVVGCVAGARHSVLLTERGSVLVFGENKFGQHGMGDTLSRPSGSELLAVADARVVKLAAGWSHTAALTREGRVLVWGRGSFGQLGHGTRTDLSTPHAVRLPADAGPAVDVVCGSEHTLVLTDSGAVFSFGWNEHGQLGVGSCEDALLPARLRVPSPVTAVSSGAGHSFAVLCHTSSEK